MRRSPRPLSAAVAGLALLSAVAVFVPAPVGMAEQWDRAADGSVILPVDDCAPELDARLADTRVRMAERQALVADLIAGRTDLGAVADRFRELDAGQPWAAFPTANVPGRTPRERYGRLVVSHVRAALPDDPRRAAVIRRLEAEVAGLAVTADP